MFVVSVHGSPAPRLRLVPAGVLAFGVVAAAIAVASCGADAKDSALPGQRLALQYGCIACHSTNGVQLVGPTWKGLYGSRVTLKDGSTATVDRDYLVRAIKDPAAQVPIVSKLPMPGNKVPEADVQLIVDYLITLT